jgi:hypothetical protein
LASTTLTDEEINQKTAMLGINQPGRMHLYPDIDEHLKHSVEKDLHLSRVGIVGERCVALYRLLAARIPPERRQALGTKQTKFNQRALNTPRSWSPVPMGGMVCGH